MLRPAGLDSSNHQVLVPAALHCVYNMERGLGKGLVLAWPDLFSDLISMWL